MRGSLTCLAVAVAAVMLVVVRPTVAAEETKTPLIITTEAYPPFNMQAEDGSVTGLATDILRAMMERAGQPYEITLMPWQRAFAMARSLPNACVYSTTWTEERKPLFAWVGPLVANDWVLFGRTGGPAGPSPQVATLDEARPYSIGGYEGDAVALYLAERGFTVATAPYDKLNPRKLAAGRIDFWASGQLLGRYLATQEGVQDIEPILTFRETQMYLACNPELPKETIDHLNGVLAKMRDEGVLTLMEERYR